MKPIKKRIERGIVMNKSKTCVECGDHVPPYLNYLCESCWEKALNAKLKEEDKDIASVKEIKVESPENRWFR
jgi:NMD protein affecting ribosome stability and mRNA decay